MIRTHNLSVQYGDRVLFEDVSLKFTQGNCYGLIGPNGAGKSTLLKVLSGEIEPHSGSVIVAPDLRVAVLRQDHFAFDEYDALTTVLMGHERLYAIMREKNALYAKSDFDDADGMRTAELEAEFGALEGWEAEAKAGEMLGGLGIPVSRQSLLVRDLDDGDKVRVRLAQAVFGDPDILLLDEPTNHLDIDSILWLEEFLISFRNTVIVVSHDRHFLNNVCTHTADIDYHKVQLYTGNYDFWHAASDMALRHRQARKYKNEDRARELKEFIARFSANASKSRQATSRKRMLGQLDVEAIAPSSRKSPHIVFDGERVHSKGILASRMYRSASPGSRCLKTSISRLPTVNVLAWSHATLWRRRRFWRSWPVHRSPTLATCSEVNQYDTRTCQRITAIYSRSTSASSTGYGSSAKISTRASFGSFSGECYSPVTSRGNRSRCSPVARGCDA